MGIISSTPTMSSITGITFDVDHSDYGDENRFRIQMDRTDD